MPIRTLRGRVGRGFEKWLEMAWACGCVAALAGALWAQAHAGGPAISTQTHLVGLAVSAATHDALEAGAQPEPPASPTGPAGWSLVVSVPGAKPPILAKRHAPSAAFTLRDGQSLDAGTPAATMAASYSGVVNITEPGRYRFGAQAQGGTAKVLVFDKTGQRAGEVENPGDPRGAWTAWADLKPGPVTVSIQFTRAAGPARLRTLWEKQGTVEQGGFPPEPIPASAVVAPKFSLRDVAVAAGAFHGRVLLGELNCTGCHSAGGGSEAVLTARTAPMLGEIGRRAQPDWLLKWVADPQAIKPGCGMPTVLGSAPQDKQDAEAITHFLVSLGGPADPQTAATEPQVLDIGRRLYHTVGCVACHGALEAPAKVFSGESQPTTVPAVRPPQPFGNLAGKWRPGPLSEFLKDPLRTHPAGRMPSMLLNDSEADSIATYLVHIWGPGEAKAEFKPDAAKAEAGKAVFAARGCASCHQLGGNRPPVPPTLKAKPLADLAMGAGCLSPTDKSSPRFGLSEQDRADLAAAIDAVKKVIALDKPSPTPLDEGERLIAAFGCVNCHIKDEQGGVADTIKPYFRTVDDTELGDEGRLPPRLTGVGNKLNPPWMRAVLTEAGRARPYMAARMPQFGKLNVGRLHTMLVAIDGAPLETDNPAEPKPTDELVLAGRKLVGDKGMNCISCHAYAGKTAGTAGPDITSFAERVRYDWFKQYVLAPARYKPGTRMTAFFASGVGPVQNVLSGDPGRQTDALWAYFTTSKLGPAPEGLPADGKGLPVAIGDKPVVFRTFLKDAGSRGIAVGYPIGIHFGFDANAVRLVDAWKGDFIDATSAWKSRGGQIATGQGATVWTAPDGPALVIGARPERWPTATGHEAGYQFKGYRFEKDGTPVFVYTIGGPNGASGSESAPVVQVSEKFIPRPKAEVLIAREFEISGLAPGSQVWLNAGKGQCRITSAGDAKVEQVSGGDGSWFGVTPPARGSVAFVLEVTP